MEPQSRWALDEIIRLDRMFEWRQDSQVTGNSQQIG